MGYSRALKKYLFIISVLFPVFGFGQEQFYANIDAREVLTNSYFEVRFVLENASGSDFAPPDFSPFKVVSDPSTLNELSFVNGRRSQKLTYVYTLMAEKEGSYTIGSASVKVKKKTLTSNPLEIKVVKRDLTKNIIKSDDVFILTELSDSVVYPGQQVLLRYVLYSRKRVGDYNFLSNLSFEGFYPQEISTNEKFVRRIINGEEYISKTLRTIALFPIKEGELYIEPMQMNVEIIERYNPFFRSQSIIKDFTLSSEEKWVKVNPLPADPPEGYNGAIGKYRMKAELSPRQISTDDAASLKLTIEGTGFSKFIVPPELNLTNKFEVYDPKALDETFYINNNNVTSKKTFEYLLVPKSTGVHKIHTSFSYFDTDSARYETIQSPVFNVIISQGTKNASGLTSEEVLEKYQLKPMMLDTQQSKSTSNFYGSVFYYVLLTMLLLLIPALLTYKWYLIRKGRIDPTELKKRKAAKEASKRLQVAKHLLDSAGEDNKAFYKAISDALEKYIADKFMIQTAELSKDRLRKQLEDKELDKDDIDKYYELLSNCELALFGGISAKANKELYENAAVLLQKMLVDLEKTKK